MAKGKFKVTIDGDRELMAKFANLGETVQGKTLERSLVAGSLPIQNAAKVNAPVLTGNLRRSIHIGGHDDLAPDRGDIEDKTGQPVPRPEIGRNVVAVYTGTDVNYAAPVEYGTKSRRARPYLRKAADETKGDVVSEVAAAWRKLVLAASR